LVAGAGESIHDYRSFIGGMTRSYLRFAAWLACALLATALDNGLNVKPAMGCVPIESPSRILRAAAAAAMTLAASIHRGCILAFTVAGGIAGTHLDPPSMKKSSRTLPIV
jgi:hypothetical protein